MTTRRKPWRFLLSLLLLAALGLMVATGLVQRFQQRADEERLRELLLTEARLLEVALRADPSLAEARQVADMLSKTGIETIVLDTSGQIRLKTGAPVFETDLLARPEVQATLRDGKRMDWQRSRSIDGRPQFRLALRAAAPDGTPNALIHLSTSAAPPPARRAFVLVAQLLAVICLAAAPAVLLLWLWLRRRLYLRVVQTLRNLPLDTRQEPRSADRAAKSDLLSVAADSLRRQVAARIDHLQRQQRTCRSLIDNLDEGLVVADRAGRIVLVNPAAARLLDLRLPAGDVQVLIGQPVEAVVPQHIIQKLLLGSGYTGATQDGRARDEASDHELTIETATGSLHVCARAIDIDLAGMNAAAATGRVVLLRDVTEMQRIIQMRTDFVANASHELRTPLATIRAAVETLLEMDLAKEASAARTFLEKIDRHSARLQQMVADLLDLSRLETPAERFQPELLECRRLLEDLHLRFADELERKQLHWEATYEPPTATTLRANPQLLRMTLDNLVDNAIKFTDPGGHVAVRLQLTPSAALLEVSDDGCGIPEEDQERVFERFYQVQRARSGVTDRGTGLGLAIVRHAVQAMHGSVRLESRLGKGTRVAVTIPQTGP